MFINIWFTLFGLTVLVTLGWHYRTLVGNTRLSTKCMIATIFAIYSYELVNLYVVNIESVQAATWAVKVFCVLALLNSWLVANTLLNAFKTNHRLYRVCMELVTIGICPLIFIDGFVLNGVRFISLSFTTVKGEFYWAWQMIVLVPHLITLSALCYWFFKKKAVEPRETLMFYSYVPPFTAAILVFGFMQLGVEINAGLLIPLSLMLIPIGAVAVENDIRYVRTLLGYFPWTKEHQYFKKAGEAIIAVNEHGLQQALETVEEVMIDAELNQRGGNRSQTAAALGVSRSTLQRRIKELNEGFVG